MKARNKFYKYKENGKKTNIIPILYTYSITEQKEVYSWDVFRDDVFIGSARLAYGGFYQVKSKRCKRWSKTIFNSISDCIEELNKRMG